MDIFQIIDKLNSLGKPAELSFTLRIGEPSPKDEDVSDNCGGGIGFSVAGCDEDDPIEQPDEECENAKRKK